VLIPSIVVGATDIPFAKDSLINKRIQTCGKFKIWPSWGGVVDDAPVHHQLSDARHTVPP